MLSHTRAYARTHAYTASPAHEHACARARAHTHITHITHARGGARSHFFSASTSKKTCSRSLTFLSKQHSRFQTRCEMPVKGTLEQRTYCRCWRTCCTALSQDGCRHASGCVSVSCRSHRAMASRVTQWGQHRLLQATLCGLRAATMMKTAQNAHDFADTIVTPKPRHKRLIECALRAIEEAARFIHSFYRDLSASTKGKGLVGRHDVHSIVSCLPPQRVRGRWADMMFIKCAQA
jgi:hypothetical protein